MSNTWIRKGGPSSVKQKAIDLTDGTYAEAVALETSLPSGEAIIGKVATIPQRMIVELTRPNDILDYAANDVISNATGGTSAPIKFTDFFRVNAGYAYLFRIGISTNKKSITPRIRAHFFNAIPTAMVGDSVKFKELYADSSARLGFVDLPAMTTAADAAGSDMSRTFNGMDGISSSNVGLFLQAAANSKDLYVVLETLDAIVAPASGQKFTVSLAADLY